jgi:hypothetical protein
MKKSKFFLTTFFCTIGLALFLSCSKDDLKAKAIKTETINFNQENQTVFSKKAKSGLLIEPIPFYNKMFHFPNMASFNAVKKEITERAEDYKSYFKDKNLNFSSFDKITKVSEQISEGISEDKMMSIIKQYNININKENEVSFKYNLLYKNLLLNDLGLVEIGSQIVQFENGYMYSFKNLEHFELFLNGREKPLESVKLSKYTSSSYERSLFASCGCTSAIDLGGGLKCLDRRVKGTIEIEQNGFSDNTVLASPFGGCSVTYDMEASSVFQKKVFGIWWNQSADQIKVTTTWSIFNNRGSNDENVCSDPTMTHSLSNNSNVQLFRVLFCDGNWSPGRGPCKDALDPLTNGVLSAISTHTASQAGKCNSLNLTCTTPNCI